jgi:ribonuclease BN (tRNA processing enzyme)
LLQDAGEPLSRTFRTAGFDYDALDGVVLSHLHGDHVGGLLMFLQSLWLQQRRRPLPIWLPAHGIEPIRQLLRASCLFEEMFPFRISWHPLQVGKPFQCAAARITPFRTRHLDGFRELARDPVPETVFDAFSFLIESSGQRVAHSADIGAVADLEPLVGGPLDCLICETAHVSVKELFAFLRGRSIQTLALIHLDHGQWQERAKLREEAARELPETRVVVPEDGDVISF